jgi:hypothetical protein
MTRREFIDVILEAVSQRSAHEVMMQRWGPAHLKHAKATTPYELFQHLTASKDASKKMQNALLNKAKQGNKAAVNVLKSNMARSAKRRGPSLDPSLRGVKKPMYKQLTREARSALSQDIADTFKHVWDTQTQRKRVLDQDAPGRGSTMAVNFGGPVVRNLNVKN